jgi:hypothetical protein
LEGLTDTGHIAMAEYAKTAGEKRPFHPIPRHILILQKGNHRLSHR